MRSTRRTFEWPYFVITLVLLGALAFYSVGYYKTKSKLEDTSVASVRITREGFVIDGKTPWPIEQVALLDTVTLTVTLEVAEYLTPDGGPPLFAKVLPRDSFPLRSDGHLVQGKYSACENTLELNEETVRRGIHVSADAWELVSTFTHELGHAYDLARGRTMEEFPDDFNCDSDFYSPFVLFSLKTNYREVVREEDTTSWYEGVTFLSEEQHIAEDFADSFRQYSVNHDNLKEQYPKRYQFLRTQVFCAKYDKAKEILRELQRLLAEVDAPIDRELSMFLGPGTLCPDEK